MRRLAPLLIVGAMVVGACSGPAATPTAAPTDTPIVTAVPQVTGDPGVTPQPWTIFTASDGSFSVGFPGSPTVTTTKSPTATLGDVTVNAYTVVGVGAYPSYIAMQERFAAGTVSNLGASDLASVLDEVISGYATNTSGTVSNQSAGTFKTMAAMTATVESSGQIQAVMTFAHGDDVYILAVIHSATSAPSGQFFDSFKLP